MTVYIIYIYIYRERKRKREREREYGGALRANSCLELLRPCLLDLQKPSKESGTCPKKHKHKDPHIGSKAKDKGDSGNRGIA